MKKNITVSAVLMLLLCITAACLKDPAEYTQEDFLPLIKRYNETLIEAHAQSNVDLMRQVTSEKDIENIRKLIEGLRSHNVRMLAKMISVKVTGMATPGRTSSVIFTEEKWHYTYNDIKTGEIKDRKADVTYNMAYIFMLEKGRWRITRALSIDDYEKLKANAEL